jgi:hypothetical protein
MGQPADGQLERLAGRLGSDPPKLPQAPAYASDAPQRLNLVPTQLPGDVESSRESCGMLSSNPPAGPVRFT